MKYLPFILACQLLFGVTAYSQSYTAYFTGDTADLQAATTGGICLMGGATENDHAMRWFLRQANGGDVLILRASGSDGYNSYLFSQLNVRVNSVETIVFHDATAATEPYIHQKIQQAEAIWFAGGDQWNYITYWRNNAIDSLINDAITNRNVVIGGTSAGMAIQGGFYFSAQNGSVTSSTALANPFDSDVTVDSSAFIANQYLRDVITDTHYDNPDRKGRHLAFMARILVDYGVEAKGIACDEYTAICIDTNGIARVFGNHPDYDDNAYFIQTNCALTDVLPENCSPNNPLEWNLGNKAIKVYAVKGTIGGTNTFDLTNWHKGVGGSWEHWYVDDGVLHEQPGTPPTCFALAVPHHGTNAIYKLYPNPSKGIVSIEFADLTATPTSLRIINQQGQIKKVLTIPKTNNTLLNVADLPPGIYFIELSMKNKNRYISKLIIN